LESVTSTKQRMRSPSLTIRQWAIAKKSLRRHWQLYLLVIPCVIYFVIFKYIPMANVVLAFKDYNVIEGIWGSPWVGFKYFTMFFNNPQFGTLIKNTLYLSVYQLAVDFPLPILLALCLNEVRNKFFKRMVQMVTYAPYFISSVVMISIMILLLNPRLGIINMLLRSLGFDEIDFLGDPEMFRSVYVWAGAWQNTGYAAVIYFAALAGVDPSLYEAAKVDGASRFQRILNIDIPGIMPTAVIVLILNIGGIMSVGFERVYLLQNPLNLGTSEVIATYVYKIGLLNANFGFATAVGLFNSIINVALLLIVNAIAKRVSSTSLW
jgi:putative aldouronate transport system permease protein